MGNSLLPNLGWIRWGRDPGDGADGERERPEQQRERERGEDGASEALLRRSVRDAECGADGVELFGPDAEPGPLVALLA